MDSDVAVLHGNYFEHGGAEVVSNELARLFDAPLYYGFGLPESETGDDDIETRSLYNDSLLSPFKNSILFRDAYYMLTAPYLEELHDYDVVIFSKNELAWYTPGDEQVVISYLHTTPRTPYDLFPRKGDDVVSKAYSFAARQIFLPYTKYPDKYVANSELVARRARKYWGIPDEKIEVIYPPVEISQYEQYEREDYYLTYSRLTKDKRIHDIIKAFEGLDKKLVVGGTGEYEDHLKSIAPDNVEFRGYMPEEEKIQRLGEAKATLFNARNEDFGMVPIESFAAGTPVIGVRDGYTKYQIQDGKNGILHEPDPESIREAVHEFEESGVSWSRDKIADYSERYSREQFLENMERIVDETVEEARIDPLTTS